jgi:hypothetical protein
MTKSSSQIVIKKYDGYNDALDMHIKSKAHLDRVVKERGLVTFEEGQRIAAKARNENRKQYKLGNDAKDIIEHAKNSADRKGKIKLSDRAIDKMIEKGYLKHARDIEAVKRNERGL